LIVLILFSQFGQAAGHTGPKKILEVGCHKEDGTCFATIEGGAVGPSSCRSGSIRWSTADANGKSILSLLLGAYLAEKPANFWIIDSCFSGNTSFPTFSFVVL